MFVMENFGQAKILRHFSEQLGVLSATELILQQVEPAYWILHKHLQQKTLFWYEFLTLDLIQFDGL